MNGRYKILTCYLMEQVSYWTFFDQNTRPIDPKTRTLDILIDFKDPGNTLFKTRNS